MNNKINFSNISFFYNPKILGAEKLVDNIIAMYESKLGLINKIPLILNKQNQLLHKYENQLVNSDLIICVGGDGTALRLAQSIRTSNVPIFGIRMGRLGFLTESTADEASQKIESILKGKFYIEKRRLIKAIYEKSIFYALNDFVIGRKNLGKTASIGVWINNIPIAEYRSDAVIIASATGSTGYTLSIGGPILMPNSDSMIIMPLAPHLTPSNPIVLEPDNAVDLQILRGDESIMVIDGIKECKINAGKKVQISISTSSISFIRVQDSYNFLNRVADKLGWLRKDNDINEINEIKKNSELK